MIVLCALAGFVVLSGILIQSPFEALAWVAFLGLLTAAIVGASS